MLCVKPCWGQNNRSGRALDVDISCFDSNIAGEAEIDSDDDDDYEDECKKSSMDEVRN